ncbi:FAD-binding oxidoreductase [Methylomicrobium sp. Wu6]|uniref:NAD(P)/FAD-dependent oxidoreductase n=1 Tax=Methylomicrobium sp. Wu6 TaxID=3107928 RepID=UPI002DD6A6B9|nr:FAD-binding oxidoreductase [Methylomicrobium sp. Wu6]MEC4748148.1 FAD-binding oxidoreductase [Methylomicrobium sp. Wu6]
MAETKPVDFLIVGFGLAGGLLAWELIRRGCRVIVADDGKISASQVAAGLINPVTGQRFVKTAEIDHLLPAARAYYADLAKVFTRPFYIEKPMQRQLRSEKEVMQCRKRLEADDYRGYLGGIVAPSDRDDLVGYLEQKQTGYLLTQPLLVCLADYFRASSAYRQAQFDYRDLQFDPVLQWQEFCPRRIIFCEGFRASDNPWFAWLPMRPAKGEILTLEHALPIPDRLFNDGRWLLPVGSGRVRLGATFDRDRIDSRTTEQAKTELIAAGERLFPGLKDARLIAHAAGVRPCTEDRQPLIGKHPQLAQLNIFNGFGAKGSLMIPWYCRRFADYLLKGDTLPLSCDIKRYERTHFPGCQSP